MPASRPAVSVSDPSGRPVSRVRVARYRFGEHEVIALLDGQLDVKTSFGRDGVTVYEDAQRGRVVRREVDVTLPRAAHVTNVRTGEVAGARRAACAPRSPPARLSSSRSARRGAPLRLEGPARGRLGEASVFTVSAASAARRLLRFHVLGPGGAFLPEYARVSVAEGPSASFTLPSAVNDPPGEYRLRVGDVLSGATAEAVLRLE